MVKTATLPAVRVEPLLRTQAESVLADGESLSEFVEAAVRDGVQRRLAQGQFVQRGLAALAAAPGNDALAPAADVLARLQARLDRARSRTSSP